MSDLLQAAIHPPVIVMRAAWYTELAGQESVYYPLVVGRKYWATPPSSTNLGKWMKIRQGVMVRGGWGLVNLAVKYDGTPWLLGQQPLLPEDAQPVSWTVDNAAFCSIHSAAAYGKTSVYPDAQAVAVIAPNPAVPDPTEPKIKGNVGRSLLITATFADGTSISETLLMYPQPVPSVS